MSVYQEIKTVVFENGRIDPKDGALNFQVQVQVDFDASERLEAQEITQEEYDKIIELVKAEYPTTGKPC